MSARTLTMTDQLHQYLLSVSAPMTEPMQRLREETAEMTSGGMQISAEQGQFMKVLIKLIGAKKCLEIGVFTGYSSLCVAQALPKEGHIYALDVSEEFTSVARRYWEEAGVAHKITLTLAPGTETLEKLLSEGHAGTFDFVFIDADKHGYDSYYEAGLKLARPGGLIGIDNTLWSGRVADPDDQDEQTRIIRLLNAKIHEDARVDAAVVPIGDGLTLCVKK